MSVQVRVVQLPATRSAIFTAFASSGVSFTLITALAVPMPDLDTAVRCMPARLP